MHVSTLQVFYSCIDWLQTKLLDQMSMEKFVYKWWLSTQGNFEGWMVYLFTAVVWKISISVGQHCLPLAVRKNNHKLKYLLWLKENSDIQVVYDIIFPFFRPQHDSLQSPYLKSLKLFFSNQHETAERKIKGCS